MVMRKRSKWNSRKKELDRHISWYPRYDDREEVEKQFTFYGPLALQGPDPFQVTEEKKISKAHSKI